MTTWRGPIYPFLLALSFWVGGVSIPVGVIVSKISELIIGIAIYGIGKNLYGRITGLISAFLLVTVTGVVRISTEIRIDPIMTALLYLSILFLILSLEKGSIKLSMVSGLLLGLSFLTKDAAITWLPIPIYLFLSIRRFRSIRSIDIILTFYFVFLTAVIPWWVWVYLETGQIYLATSLIKETWAFIIPWIFLSIPIVLTVIWFIRKWFIKKLAFLASTPEWLAQLSAFLIWAMISYIFTVLLYYGVPRNIYWMISNAIQFYQTTMLTNLNFFQIIPISWLLIGILGFVFNKQEDRILLFLGLACLPVWLFISWNVISTYGWYAEIRQSFTLVVISYLALGRFFSFILGKSILLGNFLSKKIICDLKITKLKFNTIANSALILVVGITGLNESFGVMSLRNSGNDTVSYQSGNATKNWYNPATQTISGWLSRNTQDGKHILMAGDLYQSSFYLQISKNLKLDLLPFQEKYTFLKLQDGKLCLATGSPGLKTDEDKQCNIAPFFYLVRIPRKDLGYHFVTLDDMKQLLIQKDIDYVYLPVKTDYYRHTFNFLPSLFNPIYSSAAFQLSFKYSEDGIDLYIFKVNKELVGKIGLPPLILDYDETWKNLQNEAKQLVSDNVDFQILTALGDREIRFVGEQESAGIQKLYIHLGDVYAEHGKIDEAVRQYRAALDANKDLASTVFPLAQSLDDRYSSASTKVLLADALLHSNEIKNAASIYQDVISLQEASQEWKEDAYFGLGISNYTQNQIEDSLVSFQKAYESNPVNDTYKWMLIDDSLLAKKQQDIALALERSIISIESQTPPNALLDLSSQPEYLVSDLLSENWVVEKGDAEYIHTDIFTISNVPRKILFEHPVSTARFDLSLTRSAHLKFSIGVSPEVWDSAKGDGVQFNVTLETQGSVYVLLDQYIDPKNVPADRRWFDYDLDLSRWEGQEVKLRFMTGPGPNGNLDFDWAGWGNPRITIPAEYSFVSAFSQANVNGASDKKARLDLMVVNDQLHDVIFEHPSSKITYSLKISSGSALCFGYGMDPTTWSPDNGDGVDFQIEVYADRISYTIFSEYIDPKNNESDRHWFTHCISLELFANQNIQVSLITSPGPKNDFNFDWAGWSNPVIVKTSEIPFGMDEN